jgi:2-methylisocitrate lyase-like PEP mutase family enzyme
MSKEDIAEVLRSVDRPVNVLAGLKGFSLSHTELSQMGVRRISVGGSLARAALGGFLRAAQEMQEQGTFTFVDEAANYKDLATLLQK